MKFWRLLAVCAFSTFLGCGESDKKASTAGGTDVKEVPTPTKSPVKTEGEGLAFLPMEFGPYIVEDFSLTTTSHIVVEAGYTDIRQQKDGDQEDIFDFRLKSVAVGSAANIIPKKASSGCSAVDSKTFTGGTVISAKISGFYDGTLAIKTGVASAVDRKGSSAFKTDMPLSASFSTGAADIALPSELKIPKPGSIQLAQAFDLSVSVNTSISDVNENLSNSDKDLLIGDVGNGSGYNLIVVTFYGGTAAKTSNIRCYIKKGDMATLTKAQYDDILPIKGITGNFVQVEVSEVEGHVLWRATYAGQGSEDLLVE